MRAEQAATRKQKGSESTQSGMNELSPRGGALLAPSSKIGSVLPGPSDASSRHARIIPRRHRIPGA